MARHITKYAFSKLVGVANQSVYEAVEKGHLIAGEDDSIDILGKEALAYAEMQFHKFTPAIRKAYNAAIKAAGGKPKRMPRKKKEPTEPEEPAQDNLDDSIDLGDDGLPRDINACTKNDLDKLKSLESIKTMRFKLSRDRAEFASRELVSAVFMKLYSIDTAEFVSLAATVAPEIASICGVDDGEIIVEVEQFLEGKFYQTLKHIKQTMNVFLQGVKAELVE